MSMFEELAALLDTVATSRDRLAALELVAAAGETSERERRWLAQRAHLIARGGVDALLREAGPAEGSGGAPGPRRSWLLPLASSRPPSGPERVFETGLSEIGAARFTPDGQGVIAFAWGTLHGELAQRFGELDGSLLLEMSLLWRVMDV
jgi:hypothetical protein